MEASQRRQADTVDDSILEKGTRRKKRLGDRCVFGGNICMEAQHSKKNINIYSKAAEKLRETPELMEAHQQRASFAQVKCA